MKNFAISDSFRRLPSFAIVAGALLLAGNVHGERGTVKGDRCNVRALPSMNAEVVTQLNKGDAVEVLEHKTVSEAGKTVEWLRIPLPANAKCYVHAKYVTNGVVNADAVYVRSGAGANFRDVGKLNKGARVEVVGKEGDWVRIKATPDCSGWIAAELVTIEAPAPPAAPPPSAQPVSEIATPPVAAPVSAPPAVPPVRIVDISPEEQVQYIVKVGVLRAVDDARNAPGSYELMTPEVERRQHRLCYLETTKLNLDRYRGKLVRVQGDQHWRKGERFPVVVVDRVDIVW
jgi:uncharacterized protein YgiM (DUF1202 family)